MNSDTFIGDDETPPGEQVFQKPNTSSKAEEPVNDNEQSDSESESESESDSESENDTPPPKKSGDKKKK